MIFRITFAIAIILLLYFNNYIQEAASEHNLKASFSLPVHEIKFGLLVHDPDYLWSHRRKEEGLDLNLEIIFDRPSMHKFKGTLMPNFGISINTSGDTSKVYCGIIWEYIFKNNFFLNLGFGGALHNGELESDSRDKKDLGSRVLFRIPIEIGYMLDNHNRISLAFDHVSNAWLTEENEGLDTIGLRYGYVF